MTQQHERQSPQEALGAPKSEFVAKLEKLWERENFVCVGLDSDYSKLPEKFKTHLKSRAQAVFNQEIVRETADLVCAYKPNKAYYEAEGKDGHQALEDSINFIHATYPEIPVILDAKRGDIGPTNLGYVKEAFDELSADAVTVHPYLGSSFLDDAGEIQLEALKPFLERKDKGIIVLCRTSNPSAGELQDLPVDLTKLGDSYKKKFGDMEELRYLAGQDVVKLYQIMAYRASKYWNVYGNVGVVVGATYPEELAVVRRIVGNMPILIPGIGAQGAEVEATVRAGRDSRNMGMIINSSRGIIFASSGENFAQAARRETEKLRNDINLYRKAA